MKIVDTKRVQGLLIEVLGWILVLLGLAALVLPGPGLLALFAGMALLATRYEWAKTRLEPIERAALKTAKDTVSSNFRMTLSMLFALGLIALGILWGVHPAVPAWWPLANTWWLRGGWSVGASLVLSGLLAAGSIVYSFVAFRPKR